MKIKNLISSNILSLFGNITILFIIYYIFIEKQSDSKAFVYNEFIALICYYFFYLIIIVLLILILVFEAVLTKKNKNLINTKIKNNIVKVIYKVFFFTGFTFSILNFIAISLYLILCFIIGLSNHLK